MKCGYHFSAKAVSFGKGQSAVAKAAYNARTQLENERDGCKTKDYGNHSEVLFEGIFAPENAPDWARDRNELWNRAEAAEKRKDGQPARNIDCAFPHQLDQQQREWMLKDFCREQFARKGMVADAVIHAPHPEGDERNYHAHILVTMRKIEGEDFSAHKSRDWNSKAQLAQWKEQWAEKGAKALERAGYATEAERWRHGHKTLSAQHDAALARGDKEFAEALHDREPTRHMGPKATGMQRRGQEADRWADVQGLVERNGLRLEMRALDAQIAALEKERGDAMQQLHKAHRADNRALRVEDSAQKKFAEGARQQAVEVRQEVRDERDRAQQLRWQNHQQEIKDGRADAAVRYQGAQVVRSGLKVADKASGAVMSLADYMSNVVSGQDKPAPQRDVAGELAGFIHDDPKLMREQQAIQSAAIKAQHAADLALDRMEDDMKAGKALSSSDVQNLTEAQHMTLRKFGDEGMQKLIEDLHARNERYWSSEGTKHSWSNDGRERERD